MMRQSIISICFVIAATIVTLAVPVKTYAGITVAVPNRSSAQATAYIIGGVLQSEFKIDTAFQPLGTLGIFVGIDSGSIHIHPEIWLPNLDFLVEKYAKTKGSLELSKKWVSAKQNICVTEQTAQLTGIRSVSDLANPVMSAKFDSDGDGQGEIWIGDRTWPSTKIERIRARSYGYHKTMRLLQMQEQVAMASVDAAVAVGRPFVFYCSWPHHLFKLHDVVILKEEPHDPAKWSITAPSDDPEWLTKSAASTAWKTSHLKVGFASKLNTEYPQAAAFLKKIEFTSQDITSMSYALQVERQTPEEFAGQWISDNKERIKGWMK